MSISRIAALIWLGAAGLFLYAGLVATHFHFGLPPLVSRYVWFLDSDATREKLSIGPTVDEQKDALDGVPAPPPEQEELVDYARVRATFSELDWTGKDSRAIELEAPIETEPQVAAILPVAELLLVQHIRYDSSDPLGCLVWVKYTTQLAPPPHASQLFIESRLPAPHDHVRVKDVRPGRVVFGFDDGEREEETLEVAARGSIQSHIAMVLEGDEPLRPAGSALLPRIQAPGYRPKQTTRIGKNRHRLGTDDMDYIGQNWQEILSRDVRTRRHRNAASGRFDGIEISSIARGSLATRHGVLEGDILKSINGQRVSSKPEAIKFVKNNDDVYDRWEVVIERLGKDVTVVYEEPTDG